MVLKALAARNPSGPPQPAVASRDLDLSGFGEAGGGKKKALLVGINYRGKFDHTGTNSVELSGCINDANNLHRLLARKYGFEDANIKKLTEDEPQSDWPTSANIKNGVLWLLEGAQKGDLLFFSFSGHGCQVASKDNTEADGLDEVLCPVDAWENGGRNFYTNLIRDDWLNTQLHDSLPDGVRLVVNFDCCHSGTMADLEVQRDIDLEEMVVLYVQMAGIKLAAKDSMLMGGKSDPFLIIRNGSKDGEVLLDQHNEFIPNTLDPTFKSFRIKAPKAGSLFIQCCDHDYKSTDIIGEATIEVSDFVTGKEIDLSDYKERSASELEKYRKSNPKWPGTLVVQSAEDITENADGPKNRAAYAPSEYMVRGVTRYAQMVHYHPNGTRTIETVKIFYDEQGRQHIEKINAGDDRGWNPFPGMDSYFRNQYARYSGQAAHQDPAPAPSGGGGGFGSGDGGQAATGKMLWTISGCQDHQTSADATIQGQKQGAMTWALIKTLTESDGNVTFGELLDRMKRSIAARGFDQVPSISTTHDNNYNVTFMGGMS